MGPIFNKKIAKKCNLWDRKQYTYSQQLRAGKKKKEKKKENVEKKCRRGFQLKANGHNIVTLPKLRQRLPFLLSL